MKIVALDPGGTTGWASWGGGHLLLGTTGFNAGQIGPQEHHKELFDFLAYEQTHSFTIVCEGFEYRQGQRTNVELISREYIGVAKLFRAERRCAYVEQSAGNVIPGPKDKAFWTDDKIKKLGLWSPGMKHANDAMRHLLYFMTLNNLGPRNKQVLQKLK